MLQSHFQLGRTHICPHHRRKVFGQEQSALSRAATHIHCQLKGTTFLTQKFNVKLAATLSTDNESKKRNQYLYPVIDPPFPLNLYLLFFQESPAPVVSDDLTGRSCTSSRKQHALCLQTNGKPLLIDASLIGWSSISFIKISYVFYWIKRANLHIKRTVYSFLAGSQTHTHSKEGHSEVPGNWEVLLLPLVRGVFDNEGV